MAQKWEYKMEEVQEKKSQKIVKLGTEMSEDCIVWEESNSAQQIINWITNDHKIRNIAYRLYFGR